MRELPEGWISCEIGDVAQVVGGATPASKDSTNFTSKDGIPWITPADLSGYKNMYIEQGARNLSNKGFSSCSAAKMPAGSVLFSSRAPIGYVAIAAREVTTNQGFKSFVLPEGFDSRFVYYYLRHIKPVAEMMATGTTFKELSGSAAAKLPFVIPPLNEQKRIADKLDALLARVDRCREQLDRVPQVLKRFRQSVLAAATSGRLTEEWRGENHPSPGAPRHPLPKGEGKPVPSDFPPLHEGEGRGEGEELPEGWECIELAEVVDSFSYGTSAKSAKAGKIPVLRMGNIQNGQLDWDDLVFTSDSSEIKKYRLQAGDVLFNRTNSPELVGKTAVFKGERDSIYAGYLIRVRCGESLLPDYLNYCLNSPAGRDYCWEVKSDGVSQSNINAKKLAAFFFPLPPLPEQHEIIRRVKTLFAFADRLEARYSAARKKVDNLTPSLLAKAFRGELVPQNPDDEPAEKLLERIRNRQNPTTPGPSFVRRVVKSKTLPLAIPPETGGE